MYWSAHKTATLTLIQHTVPPRFRHPWSVQHWCEDESAMKKQKNCIAVSLYVVYVCSQYLGWIQFYFEAGHVKVCGKFKQFILRQ